MVSVKSCGWSGLWKEEFTRIHESRLVVGASKKAILIDLGFNLGLVETKTRGRSASYSAVCISLLPAICSAEKKCLFVKQQLEYWGMSGLFVLGLSSLSAEQEQANHALLFQSPVCSYISRFHNCDQCIFYWLLIVYLLSNCSYMLQFCSSFLHFVYIQFCD